MSGIYDWSLRASENAGADDLINWSEGQAPHTVNDSARGMMQRMREYISDTGGAIKGTVFVNWEHLETVITLQNRYDFSTYKNGIVLRFKSSGWNVGATTVSLNALPRKAVYKATATGLVPLVGDEIHKGCIYTLVYDEEISGWQLLNSTIRQERSFKCLPTGFIGAFAMERLPEGWLLCDGRSYSRSLYRDLFATIGTMWGQGGDETTFNVPDLRGMFLRGFDYLGVVDRDRSFASTQQSSLRDHEHSIGYVEPVSSSSRRKRDLSSDPETRRKQERAVGGCFDSYGTLDKVYECITERLEGAPAPHSLITKYSKRCFSPTQHGYENPDCYGGSQETSPSPPPSLDYEIIGDEECIGLTGDALERCNKAFDNEVQTPPEETAPSFEREAHTAHRFFIHHERGLRPHLIPKRAGEDLGIHDHILMTDSFGGIETRPINVSIVYGIKT
ncbi:phage tail protein [Bartonella jaculi]|uniref:Phage tail collar domain-containing protein n=1 Tax=Bartonella jaculi TaxID=686226 RepID=A0ABP9NAM3_9HYPH